MREEMKHCVLKTTSEIPNRRGRFVTNRDKAEVRFTRNPFVKKNSENEVKENQRDRRGSPLGMGLALYPLKRRPL